MADPIGLSDGSSRAGVRDPLWFGPWFDGLERQDRQEVSVFMGTVLPGVEQRRGFTSWYDDDLSPQARDQLCLACGEMLVAFTKVLRIDEDHDGVIGMLWATIPQALRQIVLPLSSGEAVGN